MGWILATIFLLAIAGVCLGLRKQLVISEEYNRQTDTASKVYLPTGWIAGIVIGLWLVITLFTTVHQVDSRDIGVIKTFGRVTDQTPCHNNAQDVLVCGGLTTTWPWQTLDTWNIRETFVFAEGERCSNGTDKCVDAGDKDQQDVYIVPKVNIRVSPDKVQSLSAVVGTEYVDKIVRPLIITTIKKVTAEYTATDVHLKRDEIENKVRGRLATELSFYSIEVTRVTFENVAYSDAYNQAIERKSIQIQQALEEENKVATVKQQAEQRIAAAEGDAKAAIAAASGQAESNRIVNASLSPALLQWLAIQKLGDNINIALIPSGEGIILDPATLLAPR